MAESDQRADNKEAEGLGAVGEGLPRLVVFSDDWGRHPSSCQHLVRALLDRYMVTWVNTVGTRRPRLSREDLWKGMAKVGQWLKGGREGGEELPRNLEVVTPVMYPGFRTGWQRGLNRRLVGRAVERSLGARQKGEWRVAVTTLPVSADLVGRLDVDRWVYYCVDDFSVWPGLDGGVMDRMERELVAKAGAVVVVSETLEKRIAGMGREAELMTHGIDLGHWGFGGEGVVVRGGGELPGWWGSVRRPVLLFWGVVDRRLDYEWCELMARECGSLVLVGPEQSPDERLRKLERVVMPGAVGYGMLPALARAADVLVMPYADLAVTRAIQPLKFKEYLATGKPVVVRDLPAVRGWGDAADVVGDIGSLAGVIRERLACGVPGSQKAARGRLAGESWAAKARQFQAILEG